MSQSSTALNNVISTDVFHPKGLLQTYQDIQKYYDQNNCWGMLTSLDVKDCDPALIRSADAIKEYVVRLCDILKVKRFQDAIIVNFGEDEKVAGYSLVQLIETSLVSGHFANQTNTSYIDIFSCKLYDPYLATQFTQEFFGGADAQMKLHFRF